MSDEVAVPGDGDRRRSRRGTREALAAGDARPGNGSRRIPGHSKREKRVHQALSIALAAGMAAAIAAGMSGCSTNPHSPDLVAPPTSADSALNAGSGGAPPKQHHSKPQGIPLPNTITLAYDRTPTFADLTHHIVLWSANQALRAELAASYQKTSAATPDLRRYWTGMGYTEAYDWSQNWISTQTRPVGRVVVSAVSVDSLTNLSATVSYCQDMSAVIRGDAKTHTGGKALQPPHTNGEHVVLTLVPTGTKGLWQVTNQAVEYGSLLCPPSAEHRSKLA